jgi:dienelactone hydrolase
MAMSQGPETLALPTPAEHAAWLAVKRQELTRLLGGFPPRTALVAQVIRREEEADRVVEVLQYELGKSEVVGWAGNPQQAYASELCARGYATLSPDTVCFEDRRDPRFAGEQCERFLSHELLLKGLTLQGKMIWDVTRAVDCLQSRPEVDKDRIGMIGHSMGAAETWFSMSLESRIKVGVASCATTTFAAILAAGAIHNDGLYVPGLLTWGDVPDIVAMIAPRPFFFLTGEQDWRFPVSGAREVYARAKMMYSRLGAPDAIDLYVSPGGHEFNDEMRRRAYHWLDRWL